MGIFKENLDSKESELQQNLHLPTQVNQAQTTKISEMNEKLQQESQQDNVLTVTGLEEIRADQFEKHVTDRYKITQRKRDPHASDREIRRRAEKKSSSAVKLRKMLQELGNTGRSFDEIIKSNYTIFRLNSFNKKKIKGMSDDDIKKMETLKKQAPKVYERKLKLEHVNVLLTGKEDQYRELFQFLQRELIQASNEWEHVENMANQVTYTPSINKETERLQLENKRKEVEKGEQHKKDKYTELDQAYKDELAEHLKPIDNDLELDLNAMKRKAFLSEKEQMDYVLTEQMQIIKEKDPSATPQGVKTIVKEYLKKLADASELRFRVHANAVTSILNSRYRSAYDGKSGKYASLMEKQFSQNTKLKTYEAFSFGILGGKNAKEFSGFGKGDACEQFGTVSFKLKKDKMAGRATFTCGNSMGQIKDEDLYMKSLSFYDVKHARSVHGDIDIAGCGANLSAIYFRAKALKENDYKDIQSAEQEALTVIGDRGIQKYFEAQLHGQVGAAEIDELTIVMSNKEKKKREDDEETPKWNFSKMEDLEAIKNNPDVKQIYDAVNIVNKNAEEYGRKPEDGDIKVTLWDCYGHTVTFEDLKFIMEK